ncbi:MAG: tetratricopeptide repeat protein [Pseudomonadota bacterium]
MSEYLSEEEQVARMKSWWDEYGNAVLAAVVIAVVGIVGWRWYDGSQQQQAFDGATAYQAYIEAEADAKAAAAETVKAQYPGSAYHMFVLLDEAAAATTDGDLVAAAGALQTVVDASGAPLLTDLARIRLAKVLRQQDQAGAALQLLALVTSPGYTGWALEAKGDIHAAQDEVALAHQAYQAALEQLAEGEQRPLLEMKLKNTAPFDDQYVQLANPLDTALEAATATLEAAEEAAAEEIEAAAEEIETATGELTIEDDTPAEVQEADD